MVFIAIVNRAVREAAYGRHVGELRVHQVSPLSAIVLFSGHIWLLVRLWSLESSSKALLIGVMWVVLTVAFEFLFGRYVASHPWSRLPHDYNVFAGRPVVACVPVGWRATPWGFFHVQRAG